MILFFTFKFKINPLLGEFPLPQTRFFVRLFLFACVFTICAHSAAFAQLTPQDIDRANQQSERIQRERALQQQDEAERALRSRRPSAHIEAPTPVLPQGKGEGCLNIEKITILGASRMVPEKKDELSKKYAGKCVGVNQIQSLMGEITAFYIDKGYSTTRAYLPEQDLTKGTLTIQVIEGKVSKIKLKDGDKGSLYIPNAFIGVEGDILNLRDIEQGLDQINRLASNNATMDILPGETVGESTIVVNNTPTKRWHVNISGDNYGTRTTGRNQAGVTLGLDDLLGFNEFYNYSGKKTFPLNDRDTQSESNSLLFSMPFGYLTFTGGYSDSDYNSQLSTPSGLIVDLSGNSHSWYSTLDCLVYRDRDTKIKLSSTLTSKESNNYVEGARLAISSRTLTVFDLGLSASTPLAGGFLNLGTGYSRGLRMLGAQKDLQGLPSSAPRAQFDKLTASASYFYPFQFKEQEMSFSTSATAQYGLDTLFGSEQFSVGGIYSVRGFFEESLANDLGALVRNDLSLTKRVAGPDGQTMTFRPYVAIDAGAVGSNHASKTPSGALVGAAAGFSLAWRQVSFDVYAGHPLVAPDEVDNEGFNSFGRLSVNF